MRNKKLLTALGLAGCLMAVNVMGVMAADLDESVNDNKITFTGGGTPGETTPPVDPEDPDTELEDPDDDKQKETENDGDLRIDNVPVFDFGSNKITSGDASARVFKAKLPEDGVTGAYPYNVMITDLSGTGNGYTLSAEMKKQFTSTTDSTHVLAGSTISLSGVDTESDASAIAPSAKKDGVLQLDTKINLASAQEDEGMGVVAVRFGDVNKSGTVRAEDAVKLTIPVDTKIYTETYNATIQWTLSASPTTQAGL